MKLEVRVTVNEDLVFAADEDALRMILKYGSSADAPDGWFDLVECGPDHPVRVQLRQTSTLDCPV